MIRTLNKIKKHVYDKIQTHAVSDDFQYLSDTMYEKDNYTFEHCKRVTYYSALIGKELKLPAREMESLIIAAFFHDFGKISIPKGILNKQGPLSDTEWRFMQFHPKAGAAALQATGCPENIVSAVLFHHERYDGAGYPQGLKGEEIPFLARIISVADSYDAMTTNRSYSGRLSAEEALRELTTNKGAQFDPAIVDIFTDIIEAPSMALQSVSGSM